VALGLDEAGLEPISEEVTPAFVPLVEPLGVDPVEPMNAARESDEGRCDDEVIVIRHQAEGVTPPLEALRRVREEADEEAVVVRVAKDFSARDAACRYVVRAVSQEFSRAARHGSTVGAAAPPRASAAPS
jgi:hypothetical protein